MLESHRATILETAQKVERDLREQMASIEENAYGFAREKGMKIYELTPDQVAEWRACSSGIVEDFMNNAGDLGRRLMVGYGKLRTDPCCSSGPAGAFNGR